MQAQSVANVSVVLLWIVDGELLIQGGSGRKYRPKQYEQIEIRDTEYVVYYESEDGSGPIWVHKADSGEPRKLLDSFNNMTLAVVNLKTAP